MTLSFLLFATLLLACNSITDVDAYLENLHKEGRLNGNVLVVRNDTVLYTNSFGYADGTKQHLLTPDHRFALGSIYKEFPGVAIMQLKENGLLSLEDTLSRFMPHLPAWANQITVRHLLQYSSGLPKINWNSYFEQGIRVNKMRVLQELPTLHELEFEPGTDYLYSNYNPFLLMEIVESLTGMRFKEYVEQRMLLPHEIEGVVIKEEYPYKDARLMAIPFDRDFKVDDYEVELTTICSSATGMYTWFSKLDNFEIITKESVQELSDEAMQGSHIQSPLGHCDWEANDIRLHFHHGNSQNYESLVRNYKEDGLMIILMTNQDNENLYDIADNLYAYYKAPSLNRKAANTQNN